MDGYSRDVSVCVCVCLGAVGPRALVPAAAGDPDRPEGAGLLRGAPRHRRMLVSAFLSGRYVQP